MGWFAENWLSFVSVTFAVFMGLTTLVNNVKKDSGNNAAKIATIITKLDNISIVVTEIKCEMSNVKVDMKDLTERLVACEQSVKSAHRRIDEHINQKGV